MTSPTSDSRLTSLIDPANRPAFEQHHRNWQSNRYVYPVISRRSGGVSIGVNLNPDKVCNFDCVYCSVDRRIPGGSPAIDLAVLRTELTAILADFRSGKLFESPPFANVSPQLRRLNDIAFSGDGEPTSCPDLSSCLATAVAELGVHGLGRIKIVLITNATLFHRPAVMSALAYMDEHNGEIWAKLDAGTEDYYRTVDRTSIPFDRIISNIRSAAALRPIVIQTLLMRLHGRPTPDSEISAYIRRLQDIVAGGGKLKMIQLYTVARAPAEPFATPLSLAELEAVAERVRPALPNIPIEVYP